MWKSYTVLFVYLVCCVLVGLLITRITPNECITRKCKQKSKLIIRDMDSSVRPCDNFYKFTCGNYKGLWSEVKKGKEDSIWKQLKKKQLDQLISFLSRASTKYQKDRVFRVIKMLYNSCLDTKSIDREGVQPILNQIQKAGGFPLIEGKKWNKKSSYTNWNLAEIEYNTRSVGFSGGHIFKIFVDQFKDSEETGHVHVMPRPQLEFYDKHFDEYYKYMKTITSLLKSKSLIEEDKEINETLKFKSNLAKITRMAVNCSSHIKQQELEEFSRDYSFLDVKRFLEEIFPHRSLPKHIIVDYIGKEYFTGVENLMNQTHNLRVIANYLMVENIIEVTPMLPTSFRNAYNELLGKIKHTSIKIDKSRDIVCIKCVKNELNSALSSFYLRANVKYYKSEGYLLSIINSLKKQMRRVVRNLQWMDEETKRKALNKINVLTFASPLPKDMFNDLKNKTLFRIYYEDLCFTGHNSDSLSAYMEIKLFKTDKNWELFDRETVVFDRNIDIFTAEIAFDRKRNCVIIPMGFLMYPVFDERWPNYLTYGGLCSKIAMELVRGIDFTGAQYGLSGEQHLWWSLETRAEYNKHTRCFTNQYNDYLKSFVNVTLEDSKCVEDNIARLVGLKIAYMAYEMYNQQRFFPERSLFRLKHYSTNEMFFIDFATFYCDTNTIFYHNQMTEEEASKATNEYQVIGSLRNSEYFSKIFYCSVNDTMNPPGKCDLWNTPNI